MDKRTVSQRRELVSVDEEIFFLGCGGDVSQFLPSKISSFSRTITIFFSHSPFSQKTFFYCSYPVWLHCWTLSMGKVPENLPTSLKISQIWVPPALMEKTWCHPEILNSELDVVIGWFLRLSPWWRSEYILYVVSRAQMSDWGTYVWGWQLFPVSIFSLRLVTSSSMLGFCKTHGWAMGR